MTLALTPAVFEHLTIGTDGKTLDAAVQAAIHASQPPVRLTDDPLTQAETYLRSRADYYVQQPGRTTSKRANAKADMMEAKADAFKGEALATDRRGRDGSPRPRAAALCGTPLRGSDVVFERVGRHVVKRGCVRCGNAHVCAECALYRRAEVLSEGTGLIARHVALGGGVLDLTLTAVHHPHNDCLDQCRRFLLGARALRGTPEWRRMASEYGLIGAGGSYHYSWTPETESHGIHYHGLLFFESPVTEAAMELLLETLRSVWARVLRKRGLYASREHGLKLVEPQHPQKSWAYIVRNPGLDEALRGAHDPKTSWGLLAAAGAAIRAGRWEDARTELNAWLDYANACSALRIAYVRWTPGLRDRLAPPPPPELPPDCPCDEWAAPVQDDSPAQDPGDPCDAWPEPANPNDRIVVPRDDYNRLVLPRRAEDALKVALLEGGREAAQSLIESLRPPPDPTPRPPPRGRVVVCLTAPIDKRR